MACVVVPAVEAVVSSVVKKAVEKSNMEEGTKALVCERLGWLNKMLWGGSALLGFEHVWHGEIVPFFPFLTGASSPESTAQMLKEMSTAGVGMALSVTLFWGVLVAGAALIEKKNGSISRRSAR